MTGMLQCAIGFAHGFFIRISYFWDICTWTRTRILTIFVGHYGAASALRNHQGHLQHSIHTYCRDCNSAKSCTAIQGHLQ
jgi:hypothetical protein